MIIENFRTLQIPITDPGYTEDGEKELLKEQEKKGWTLVYAEIPSGDARVRYQFKKMSPAARGAWLARFFARNRDAWREHLEAFRYSSDPEKLVNCPAYKEIISLGDEVLPLIFKEMKRKPDFWFAALQAITGENPVTPDRVGDIFAMTRDWLAWWGKQNRPK